MSVKELLNKKLSYKEMNDFLKELMNYSCNSPADSSEIFRIYDEEGDICDFRKHIGMNPINTLKGILFLKERIDESRGEFAGMHTTQDAIKKALGIY